MLCIFEMKKKIRLSYADDIANNAITTIEKIDFPILSRFATST